ncbi:MAG: DUF4886 domain-containing protein [Clostridia bacterium]|nr:DUF4886 domain-containing protein [Clostridia bacterium]
MLRILFIGNSFSEDATRYIEQIADGELFVRNLYIGGCSLAMHAENIRSGAVCYDYQKDASPIDRVSIQDGLTREAWDYVSIQQVSGHSGVEASYEPHINVLMDEIKRLAPQAKIVFHRTWAYDTGSAHPDFSLYKNDREYMWQCILATTKSITARYNLPIIPSGDAIAAARREPEFDLEGGVAQLTRDTFHLSLDYGRYVAGLVLYKFFTGKSPLAVDFAPENCDTGVIQKIKSVVHALDFDNLA